MSKKKITTSIKRSYKKLKYLDKTQSSYYILTFVIAAFCMFTGVTYSYFTLSKTLNVATITIAKLNYTLESTTAGYSNGSITVPAGETVFVDLELKSQNTSRTRYALNYETSSVDVNVYYSETYKNNMTGIIGITSSVVDMRVVLVNNGTTDATVKFKVSGGYLQNTLTSNITEGYFEQDVTIRTVLYDENFENPTSTTGFPDKTEYAYYKTECTNGYTGVFDEANWTMSVPDGTQTSCDVYFKKATDGLDIYYLVQGTNNTSSISTTKPDTTGVYVYKSSACSNSATYTFDETTYEFNVTDYTANTLCVANFETDTMLIAADKYTVTFDANGGETRTDSKLVSSGGTYGDLPIPTKGGYAFTGWYTDATDGTLIESTTTVALTSDQTLYAHWEVAFIPQVVTAIKNGTTPTGINTGTPTFASIAETDEGVYAMEDNYGTSYYYRGAVENNYVKFGKWAGDTPDVYHGYGSEGLFKEFDTLEECQSDTYYSQNCTLVSRAGKDMYWRIIRVNGNGSVRMIYDGTSAHANGSSSTDRVALTEVAWNETNNNDAKYVGYMYGGANGIASTAKTEADCAGQEDCVAAQKNETSSNIKTKLEEWYKTNIEDAGYGEYVADVIFCNDRSTPNSSYDLGYGTNTTFYGAYDRFVTNSSTPTPTFVCPTNSTVNSNNDWFTAEATDSNKGNGYLDQPVGMITTDEIIAAGGKWSTVNQGYYLYKGYDYWSLSPNGIHTYTLAYVFSVYIDGELYYAGVHRALAVAPVINLSADYALQLSGSGTTVSPYRLS